MLLYGIADLAFVGGSLVERGGHNPLEAAAHAIPVLMGPHTFNFKDICARLEQASGLITVTDATTLAKRFPLYSPMPITVVSMAVMPLKYCIKTGRATAPASTAGTLPATENALRLLCKTGDLSGYFRSHYQWSYRYRDARHANVRSRYSGDCRQPQ